MRVDSVTRLRRTAASKSTIFGRGGVSSATSLPSTRQQALA